MKIRNKKERKRFRRNIIDKSKELCIGMPRFSRNNSMVITIPNDERGLQMFKFVLDQTRAKMNNEN